MANKIALSFDKHHLSGVRVKDGHANHGFAKFAVWEIINRKIDAITIRFNLEEADYAPKGYPFSLYLTLIYSLADHGLTCQATVANNDSKPAPFGLGFHPYFSLGTDKIDNLVLTTKAASRVETDEITKPTGKLIPTEKGRYNFSQPRQLGRLELDDCLTSLEFNPNHQTFLSSENLKIAV